MRRQDASKVYVFLYLNKLFILIKMNKKNQAVENQYKITVKGSLGILAYGDLGLMEWRKIKQEFHKKNSDGKE